MKLTPLYTAVLAAQVSVGIHIAMTPDHLNEEVAIGVLFVVLSAVLVASMTLLYATATRTAGFVLGSLACAAQVIAFVLSRTTGLPGGIHEPWAAGVEDYLALAATAMSIVFIGSAVAALLPSLPAGNARHRSGTWEQPSTLDVARAASRPVVGPRQPTHDATQRARR